MKLIYSILWFDNSQDFFDSLDCEELENAIKSWGFTPKIMFETDPDKFMSHSPFVDLDLIVVDYDLGENTDHGETFIRSVRDNNVLTEVVFYSSNASKELWNAIAEKELEGVYIANRNAVLPRIERVARQSVQKVLDLNNMRGMVMAEVGDIDLILDQVFATGWLSLTTQHQEEIIGKFREKALEQIGQSRTSLETLNIGSQVSDILEACDSNKRWQNFNRLKRHIPRLKQCNPGDYPVEILAPRNFLAHGQARVEDGVHIFSYRGKEYRFDEAEGVRLRGRIGEYKAQLQTALQEIAQAQAAAS
jgi:hypothetical protein